jgi:hypothetical protein
LTGTRDATGRVSLGLLVESVVGQSPDEVRFPAADKLTDKWVAKRPLKGTSYFRYPSRDLRTRRLPWTVGDRATLSSQAWLIYLAKDVPKKHDIPQAIFFVKSVFLLTALGFFDSSLRLCSRNKVDSCLRESLRRLHYLHLEIALDRQVLSLIHEDRTLGGRSTAHRHCLS